MSNLPVIHLVAPRTGQDNEGDAICMQCGATVFDEKCQPLPEMIVDGLKCWTTDEDTHTSGVNGLAQPCK